jgi:hypothetical protein
MGRSLFLENNQMKCLPLDVSVSVACTSYNRGKLCSTGSPLSGAEIGNPGIGEED